MDWKSFGTAAFNGATATVSDATFGQRTWQSAGATTFAESLGADAIYHQSPNWSDITAKTAGAMVGTSLGSKMKQMSMASHQQAVHMERSAPTNVHAVASVGQPAASQGVGRKAPKPAYATKAKVTTLQASKDHGDVETAPAARMQAAANNVDAAQASRAERFMLGAAKEQGMVGQHARLFADQKSFTFRESVASLGKGFTNDLWESLPDTQALGQSIGSGVYNAVHNPTQTLSDLGSSVKSKLAYLKVLHDNPLGVLLYLKAVEKQKIETFKHDMSDAVTKVKAGDLSPIGRMGAEVFKLVALGGVAKVAPALGEVGLFARGANVERTVVATGGESLLTPDSQLARALRESKVYEQLENIHASSPNASAALKGKFSALQNAQAQADKIEELTKGSIRYYDKFRSANKFGPSSGSRFVTEYNSETGNVTMWNEVYDQQGLVNRIHLKNINGIEINSPHFPPTLKEILEKNISSQFTPGRGY